MGLDLYSRKKEIEYVPKWNGNRESDDPFFVKLRFLNQNECLAIQREVRRKVKLAKGPEKKNQVIFEEQEKMLRENIAGFSENVLIDGRPIGSVKEFLENNIEELMEELADAMVNFNKMTEGERKNLQGASGGDSKSKGKGAPSSVTPAQKGTGPTGIVETGEGSERAQGQ